MRDQNLPRQFCLRNVAVWNADKVEEGRDVFVTGGKIGSIVATGSQATSGFEILDAAGLALMPAGIDVQAHLRVPGQPQKETPLTGLRAALRGGYSAVLTMPNTQPVIDTPAVLANAKKEIASATEQTGIEVLWSAAVTLGQKGETLTDFEALAVAGVAAFTDDGKGVAPDGLMEESFHHLAKLKLPFLQHAEFPGHGGVLAPGPVQEKLGVKAYSAEAEWAMVDRDLKVLRKAPGARYHVLHISAKETIALLKKAKAEGLKVTGEVSPHHLHFSTHDLSPDDSSFKMNPPIRSPEDRAALIKALADGDIDFVATDHAPHESEKKGSDFADAAFGTTGLETCLRVLFELYAKNQISASRLVEVFSTAPARFLGLESRYGTLAPGRSFQALLIDAQAPARPIEVNELESLSKNNCFVGQKLPGRLLKVFQPQRAWEI
jgi:dihydroorotase